MEIQALQCNQGKDEVSQIVKQNTTKGRAATTRVRMATRKGQGAKSWVTTTKGRVATTRCWAPTTNGAQHSTAGHYSSLSWPAGPFFFYFFFGVSTNLFQILSTKFRNVQSGNYCEARRASII